MKPYGREKKVSQNPSWKRDYHIHEKGRKVKNWWECICATLTRSAIKRNVAKEIDNELFND